MSDARPSVILDKLEQAGFEAYYVGGCVRDFLLHRQIHDWDITTSAMPQQVMACFEHCIPTGIQHGTVTVLEGHYSAEVTTFRCDGAYADGRHPEAVSFVRNLREDLARRDFTINAMAMDQHGTLFDLYGGQKDLENKQIRCVGNPETRFREDALRMLRAVRFSAQLHFNIESETMEAIKACASMTKLLSVERIKEELEKILLSDAPEKIGDLVRMGLLNQFLFSKNGDYRRLSLVPAERTLRWAALSQISPQLELQQLRLDRHTASSAMQAARLPVPNNRLGWKYCIAEHGKEVSVLAAALSGKSSVVNEILSSGECLSLRELAVTGTDFPNLKGKEIGRMLHTILYHVLEVPTDNTRDKILSLFIR